MMTTKSGRHLTRSALAHEKRGIGAIKSEHTKQSMTPLVPLPQSAPRRTNPRRAVSRVRNSLLPKRTDCRCKRTDLGGLGEHRSTRSLEMVGGGHSREGCRDQRRCDNCECQVARWNEVRRLLGAAFISLCVSCSGEMGMMSELQEPLSTPAVSPGAVSVASRDSVGSGIVIRRGDYGAESRLSMSGETAIVGWCYYKIDAERSASVHITACDARSFSKTTTSTHLNSISTSARWLDCFLQVSTGSHVLSIGFSPEFDRCQVAFDIMSADRATIVEFVVPPEHRPSKAALERTASFLRVGNSSRIPLKPHVPPECLESWSWNGDGTDRLVVMDLWPDRHYSGPLLLDSSVVQNRTRSDWPEPVWIFAVTCTE